MPDSLLRQSPLAHLALQGRPARVADPGADTGEAGVAMAERPFRGIIDLRGDAGDSGFLAAVERVLGAAPPSEANRALVRPEVTLLWLGPNEWWIVTPEVDEELADSLREALAGLHAAVTLVGDSRTCLRVAGPRAGDLLAKGCPLDLHPRAFAAGHCAQSLLAKAGVLIHRLEEGSDGGGDGAPVYELYVLRSFADYLWRWLEDAAAEYGLAVGD